MHNSKGRADEPVGTAVPPIEDKGTTLHRLKPETIQLGNLTAVPAYEEILRRHGLVSLDALFQPGIGKAMTKPGLGKWRERVRLDLEDGSGRSRTFYLKRFHRPPSGKREVGRVSGAQSVAGVEWLWMETLRRCGIPAPSPVALGEELEGGREIRSAVLAEAVPGDSLQNWVKKWGREDRAVVRSLLDATAELVKRLHGNRFIHRDLYLCHFFYDPERPEGENLHLIDLQRVLEPSWFVTRWIVKDLAALNYSTPMNLVSNADRLRWFLKYRERSKLSRWDKWLIRWIVRKTEKIRRHEARRQEKLGNRSVLDKAIQDEFEMGEKR